ncbi:hypothetical protein BH23ACT2_BH23ACT2_08930 [soil metagenome]
MAWVGAACGSIRDLVTRSGASPDPDAAQRAAIRLAPHPDSVAVARRFVFDEVASWGFEPPGDVSLLTSETVSNAVLHAQTEAVVVRAERFGGRVRVEVEDDDPTSPEVRSPELGAVGGFGLFLVTRLAHLWGVDDIGDDGKVVWFEVTLTD